MPAVYFIAASVAVLAATVISAFIKTAATRKQLRQQLTLETQTVRQEEQSHNEEPAAMVSVG